MIIKWINRNSREEGFVKSVSAKEKHFINTFDRSEAKVYKTEAAAKTSVKSLISYGEGAENDFEIIPA